MHENAEMRETEPEPHIRALQEVFKRPKPRPKEEEKGPPE